MTGAVDIGREACERLASTLEAEAAHMNRQVNIDAVNYIASMVRALRAALDKCERERDELKRQAFALRCAATVEADATGYARGVRDAAGVASSLDVQPKGAMPSEFSRFKPETMVRAAVTLTQKEIETAILALLPATDATKETNDV